MQVVGFAFAFKQVKLVSKEAYYFHTVVQTITHSCMKNYAKIK